MQVSGAHGGSWIGARPHWGQHGVPRRSPLCHGRRGADCYLHAFPYSSTFNQKTPTGKAEVPTVSCDCSAKTVIAVSSSQCQIPRTVCLRLKLEDIPYLRLLNNNFDMLFNRLNIHSNSKIWSLQGSGTAEPSGRSWEDAFTVDTDMGFLSAPVSASANQVYGFIEVCSTYPSLSALFR